MHFLRCLCFSRPSSSSPHFSTPSVYFHQYFSQFAVKTATVIHSEDNRAVSLPSGSIFNYPRKSDQCIFKALIKLSIFNNDNVPIMLRRVKERRERIAILSQFLKNDLGIPSVPETIEFLILSFWNFFLLLFQYFSSKILIPIHYHFVSFRIIILIEFSLRYHHCNYFSKIQIVISLISRFYIIASIFLFNPRFHFIVLTSIRRYVIDSE